MHIISALLFAFSANMDNILIGLSYGMGGVRIRFYNNLIIAALTSLGTFLAMAAGAAAASLIPPQAASVLGCSLLVLMGLWLTIKSIHKKIRGNEDAEVASGQAREDGKPEERWISTKESLILAVALAANNLGFGVGAQVAGLPVAPTCVFTFFLSILLLSAGVFIGKHFAHTPLGRYTDLLSGVIITVLGVYEFFV